MNLSAACFAALVALSTFVQPAEAQLPPPERTPLGVKSDARCDALGEELFFERGLSINGTKSCADCHNPQFGYSDGLVVAEGVFGRLGQVNTPTILGAAWKIPQFNNGRILGLDRQLLEPLVNQDEMGNRSVEQVVAVLRANPYYRRKFAECYAEGVTVFTLAHAIASYETKIVARDAAIDDYMAGDDDAISDAAKRGLASFVARRCSECHPYPFLTDHQYHNNGAGWRIFKNNRDRGRNGVLPQQFQKTEFEGAFITPTLRDIVRTAPYMTSGRWPTLGHVLAGYGQGMSDNGRADRFCDPRVLQQPPMSAQEAADLMALFETFTSRSYVYGSKQLAKE